MLNEKDSIKLYHFNQLNPKLGDLQLTKIEENHLLSLEQEKGKK